jgi:hypothetical protein
LSAAEPGEPARGLARDERPERLVNYGRPLFDSCQAFGLVDQGVVEIERGPHGRPLICIHCTSSDASMEHQDSGQAAASLASPCESVPLAMRRAS